MYCFSLHPATLNFWVFGVIHKWRQWGSTTPATLLNTFFVIGHLSAAGQFLTSCPSLNYWRHLWTSPYWTVQGHEQETFWRGAWSKARWLGSLKKHNYIRDGSFVVIGFNVISKRKVEVREAVFGTTVVWNYIKTMNRNYSASKENFRTQQGVQKSNYTRKTFLIENDGKLHEKFHYRENYCFS